MNVMVVRGRGEYDPISREEWLWLWRCKYTVPVPQEDRLFAMGWMAVYEYYVIRARRIADELMERLG